MLISLYAYCSLHLCLHAASKKYREMSVLPSTGYMGRVHSYIKSNSSMLTTSVACPQARVHLGMHLEAVFCCMLLTHRETSLSRFLLAPIWR